MHSLLESIKTKAYKLEFDDIGFCEAKIPKELSKHLKEFRRNTSMALTLNNVQKCTQKFSE